LRLNRPMGEFSSQRVRLSLSRERRTTAHTATEQAVMATASSRETRTAPTTSTTAVPPTTVTARALGVRATGAGAGSAGAGVCWQSQAGTGGLLGVAGGT